MVMPGNAIYHKTLLFSINSADLGYLSTILLELLFICAQCQVKVVLNQVEGLSQVECGTTSGTIRSRTKVCVL